MSPVPFSKRIPSVKPRRKSESKMVDTSMAHEYREIPEHVQHGTYNGDFRFNTLCAIIYKVSEMRAKLKFYESMGLWLDTRLRSVCGRRLTKRIITRFLGYAHKRRQLISFWVEWDLVTSIVCSCQNSRKHEKLFLVYLAENKGQQMFYIRLISDL